MAKYYRELTPRFRRRVKVCTKGSLVEATVITCHIAPDYCQPNTWQTALHRWNVQYPVDRDDLNQFLAKLAPSNRVEFCLAAHDQSRYRQWLRNQG